MRRLLPFAIVATLSAACWAQEDADADLSAAMRELDRTFFERAFNQCDLDYLAAAIHPDLRFYHDQGGYQDRDAFLAATRDNICPQRGPKPIRVLDADSLQIFPLYDDGRLYGVIHSGIHHFYLREPGKPDVHTGVARFTSVYVLQDGKWLLKDVLSYDHRAPDD